MIDEPPQPKDTNRPPLDLPRVMELVGMIQAKLAAERKEKDAKNVKASK